MNEPFCKNCKHKKEIYGPTPWGHYYCTKIKDIVTGGSIPCRIARENDNLCGIEAKYFEQEEKKQKKKSIFDIFFS